MPASPSGSDDTSLGALEDHNATSFPQYNETTSTNSSEKDKRETAVSILEEDETPPSFTSGEVNSAGPLSQNHKTVDSIEDIKTVLVLQDENKVDPHPPEKDNGTTSSQVVGTVQSPGSIEEDEACEHKAL